MKLKGYDTREKWSVTSEILDRCTVCSIYFIIKHYGVACSLEASAILVTTGTIRGTIHHS